MNEKLKPRRLIICNLLPNSFCFWIKSLKHNNVSNIPVLLFDNSHFALKMFLQIKGGEICTLLLLREELFLDAANPMGFLVRFKWTNTTNRANKQRGETKLCAGRSQPGPNQYDRQRAESSLSTVPPYFDIKLGPETHRSREKRETECASSAIIYSLQRPVAPRRAELKIEFLSGSKINSGILITPCIDLQTKNLSCIYIFVYSFITRCQRNHFP